MDALVQYGSSSESEPASPAERSLPYSAPLSPIHDSPIIPIQLLHHDGIIIEPTAIPSVVQLPLTHTPSLSSPPAIPFRPAGSPLNSNSTTSSSQQNTQSPIRAEPTVLSIPVSPVGFEQSLQSVIGCEGREEATLSPRAAAELARMRSSPSPNLALSTSLAPANGSSSTLDTTGTVKLVVPIPTPTLSIPSKIVNTEQPSKSSGASASPAPPARSRQISEAEEGELIESPGSVPPPFANNVAPSFTMKGKGQPRSPHPDVKPSIQPNLLTKMKVAASSSLEVKGSYSRDPNRREPVKLTFKTSPPKASQVPTKMGMSYDAVPKGVQGDLDLGADRAGVEEAKMDSGTQVKGRATSTNGQVSSSASLQNDIGGGVIQDLSLQLPNKPSSQPSIHRSPANPQAKSLPSLPISKASQSRPLSERLSAPKQVVAGPSRNSPMREDLKDEPSSSDKSFREDRTRQARGRSRESRDSRDDDSPRNHRRSREEGTGRTTSNDAGGRERSSGKERLRSRSPERNNAPENLRSDDRRREDGHRSSSRRDPGRQRKHSRSRSPRSRSRSLPRSTKHSRRESADSVEEDRVYSERKHRREEEAEPESKRRKSSSANKSRDGDYSEVSSRSTRSKRSSSPPRNDHFQKSSSRQADRGDYYSRDPRDRDPDDREYTDTSSSRRSQQHDREAIERRNEARYQNTRARSRSRSPRRGNDRFPPQHREQEYSRYDGWGNGQSDRSRDHYQPSNRSSGSRMGSDQYRGYDEPIVDQSGRSFTRTGPSTSLQHLDHLPNQSFSNNRRVSVNGNPNPPDAYFAPPASQSHPAEAPPLPTSSYPPPPPVPMTVSFNLPAKPNTLSDSIPLPSKVLNPSAQSFIYRKPPTISTEAPDVNSVSTAEVVSQRPAARTPALLPNGASRLYLPPMANAAPPPPISEVERLLRPTAPDAPLHPSISMLASSASSPGTTTPIPDANEFPQVRANPALRYDESVQMYYMAKPRNKSFASNQFHFYHFTAGSSKISEYTLQQKLGEGTFGVVWKGIRGKVDKGKSVVSDAAEEKREAEMAEKGGKVKRGDVVALKEIILHNAADGMPITSLREIRILKSLEHPNVVPVIDIAYEDGDLKHYRLGKTFMVFPYMDHDLAGLLENSSVKLSEPHIKQYAKQLLRGTAYLHKNRILHRDMKAANLLINNAGVLMIADFGLARSMEKASSKKEYTVCVVTRWYRPPELLLGEPRYHTPVDMWGVGCVIAEMFKRTPIFPGSSDLDQVHRIFEMCGSPTEETMPGWQKLPGCEQKKFWDQRRRMLRHEWSRNGESFCDFLDKILVLDPRKRLTAIEALDHEWFWSDPMPTAPKDMPTYTASHEFDRRNREAASAVPVPRQRIQPAFVPPHPIQQWQGPPQPQSYQQPSQQQYQQPQFQPHPSHQQQQQPFYPPNANPNMPQGFVPGFNPQQQQQQFNNRMPQQNYAQAQNYHGHNNNNGYNTAQQGPKMNLMSMSGPSVGNRGPSNYGAPPRAGNGTYGKPSKQGINASNTAVRDTAKEGETDKLNY